MRALSHARYVRVARRAFTADRDRYWQQLCVARTPAEWWRGLEGVAKCCAALAELDEPGDNAAQEQESQP